MIADEYEEESAGLDDLDAASDEEEEDGKEEQRKCGLQQHTVGFEFKCFKKMVLGQGWQTCMGNDPGAVLEPPSDRWTRTGHNFPLMEAVSLYLADSVHFRRLKN